MMMEQMKRLMVEEEGQGMAEYGLILAGVALVAMAGFTALGSHIETFMDSVVSKIKTP
jgi:pilus assembly protein Flp/PilA